MTDKKIDSLKHANARRTRIPSQEEAGCEQESPEARQTEANWPLNPVTQRGQDPELFWLEKYGADDRDENLEVDIRSLYRTEHIAPEKLIQRLYTLRREADHQADFFVDELFANYKDIDELDKPQSYYKHADRWANRLIQGDSLMVMASLLEREGMKGQVQMIYIDPPYGIKYNSNWQIRLNDRNVKDGDDASLSGEPEVIKAFRDTWELGIHSYLSYLRDRLLVAKALLTESGSCFVQISDENVHLVRCVMDEVFGSENFCGLMSFKKTTSASTNLLASVSDYIIWYARLRNTVKYRQLYLDKKPGEAGASQYTWVQYPDGTRKSFGLDASGVNLPEGALLFAHDNITSQRPAQGKDVRSFVFQGKVYSPGNGTFKTDLAGLEKLATANRLMGLGNTLRFVRHFDDFPVSPLTNLWSDTVTSGFSDTKVYVVQTHQIAIQRCILMTTDPGDLVLDPTCGSGTTAHVAEQWGRRWITTDTSRVALNIAKT
ncbi:MAG: site-specific DNA-methyltransferase, partial [Accumulibacter sp.]|uniref:site-specific DNA-methyltransferase n=1 Tax=Accumulibacter sp. TaxID=2053492 RepID=UPI003314F58B